MGDHVDRDRPGGLDLDVGLAGGKLHVQIRGGVPVQDLADWPPREPQADPGAVHFGLAAGMIVHLDDHVGLALEDAADAVVKLGGLAARGPAAQIAVDFHTRAGEAGVAGAGLGGILLASVAAGLDVGQHVMDHAAIARPVLDARNVHVVGQAGRHHEAAIDVRANRRNREVSTDVEDQVGPSLHGPIGGETAEAAAGRPGSPRGAPIQPRRR